MIFRVRREQRLAAADADVRAGRFRTLVLARERWLGPLLARHVELLRRERFGPLRVVFSDFIVHSQSLYRSRVFGEFPALRGILGKGCDTFKAAIFGDPLVKKTIVIAVISCGVLFFVAGYFSRAPRVVQSATKQQPWNSRAIQSTFKGVQVRELDSTHAAVDFVFELENRTSSDFQLTPGPSAIIMKRLKADGSLTSDPAAHLTSAVFLPTNNRTRITLEVSEPFNWPAKQDAAADQSFREFARNEVSGLDGFVIFDQASRYEVDLPIQMATSAPSAASTPKTAK